MKNCRKTIVVACYPVLIVFSFLNIFTGKNPYKGNQDHVYPILDIPSSKKTPFYFENSVRHRKPRLKQKLWTGSWCFFTKWKNEYNNGFLRHK